MISFLKHSLFSTLWYYSPSFQRDFPNWAFSISFPGSDSSACPQIIVLFCCLLSPLDPFLWLLFKSLVTQLMICCLSLLLGCKQRLHRALTGLFSLISTSLSCSRSNWGQVKVVWACSPLVWTLFDPIFMWLLLIHQVLAEMLHLKEIFPNHTP